MRMLIESLNNGLKESMAKAKKNGLRELKKHEDDEVM
jgi:hypothetical protein